MQPRPEKKSSRMRPPAAVPADPRIVRGSELQRPERASEHLRNALQVLSACQWWPDPVTNWVAIRDRLHKALDIIEDVRRRVVNTGPARARATVLERL